MKSSQREVRELLRTKSTSSHEEEVNRGGGGAGLTVSAVSGQEVAATGFLREVEAAASSRGGA